ncbi:MG2 domain-containing protein [Tenacibaculum sp. SG-28]|uniref:MG2 domain-containing protein n=1 Tax=Tenacibaculum sp. SG-28 TaxID=754426 RepID=UPI000CF451B7|nr:MG2 domain-containing protein [Tenacibaculum sp. SG-28]
MKTNIIIPFLRIIVLSLCSLVLFTFFSCKEKTNTETDIYKFEKYIQSFPNEIISNAGPIAFVLKEQPKISKIEQDVVSILPKIKGEIYLKGNTLEFVPQEKLKSNTEYQITLHLNKLYPNIEKDLQNLSLNLKTKELLFTVSVFPPRVVTKDLYFLEGTFTASDFVETAKIKQVLSAQYNEKNKAITIESSEKNTTKVSFQIDSLARFEKDKIVQLLWNGKAIGSKSTGETNITIAGKNRFEVLSVEVIDNDKQHIEIVFSDIVSKNQNLNGLLQLTNNAKIKFNYSIKNNTVTIYPKAEFKESVDLEIFKEIKNEAGVSLAVNTIKTLYFEEPKPKVSFINSGTILPDSENLKLNFYAVNLKAVDATIYKIYPDNVLQFLQSSNFNNEGNLRYVGRPVAKYTVNLTNRGVNLKTKNAYAIDLSEIIPIENGAMYRVELSFSKAYSNYSCTSEESTSTISYGKKEVTTKAFDNPEYYERRYYNYNWRDRDNPCTVSYYYNKNISTNILATSLGAIVKKGTTDKTFIAVSDIISTAPVSDATIKLYNLQKQELYTTTTDSKGIAIIDNKEGVFFAKITKGKHTTYVKLKDGNALSMSQFDVSGSKLQEGLKGYIYGDRGVWRPGDQLFFTFVLNDANNPLPEKHPITFELSNPRAKIIDRTVQYKTVANVYAYTPKTSQDALTGNYTLRIRVGAATFTKKVKIETIKPNRLKIAIDLENIPVKADTPIRGKVQVNWLHGAIAKNLKFDITSKFYKTKTTFSSFKGYQFDDLTQNFSRRFYNNERHLKRYRRCTICSTTQI